MLPQCIDSTLEIDRVPQYDSKDDQVEAARAVTLVFEGSIAEFALAVKEDCPGQRVSGFALVEPHLNALSEFGILRSFQHKQGAFYAANLPQGGMKAVLARIARQLADNQRSGAGVISDRGSQAKNFLPQCCDQLQMKSAAY